MSIINSANPGSKIEIMCLIFRVLRRSKKLKNEDEIINICRPNTLYRNADQKKWLPSELKFWSESSHQLWERDKDGNIQLVSLTESENPTPYEIAQKVRDSLFKKKISNILTKNREGEHKIEDLLRSLSCVLISNLFTPLTGPKKYLNKYELESLIDKYLDSDKHVPNDNEKPTFLEYGHFLGFFEPSSEKGEYFVDPTRVITELLDSIFIDNNKLTVREFVQKSNEIIPVLDGGVYHQQVQDFMIENGFKGLNKNTISYGLSHALNRLKASKLLKIDSLSDDENALELQLPNGKSMLISNITYVGGNYA